MDHLEKSHEFISEITDIISRFQWEFNTHEVRSQICHMLKELFNIKFDDYWQSITGIKPQDITFVDMTTNDMVNGLVDSSGRSTYQIGISIKNSEPVPFSDFITEHFGMEAVRDRKIKEILG